MAATIAGANFAAHPGSIITYAAPCAEDDHAPRRDHRVHRSDARGHRAGERVLKVSTDELLLGREPRAVADFEISDVRLLDKFQRLQELDKRDREAVIILIDGVLARRAVESAIASAR